MRFLILVESIPPYCGGAEQVAWMHALYLSKKHDVYIITFSNRNFQSNHSGINLIFLKKYKHQLLHFLIKGQRLLNKYVMAIDPDIIHSHMPNVLHFFVKKGYPLFTTIHDGVPENKTKELNKISKKVWIKNSFIRKVNIFKSDCITCVSQHNFTYMRSRYRYKKECFEIIENPINEPFFFPVKNVEGDYILNYGRQIALKMGSLIDTARIMPNLNFKFLGSGPMVKDYGLNNIEFLGFSPEVIKWIDGASICVFPSQSENFPLVGLEAMARGKPVIATEIGFSEYIKNGENGILIKDNRPETIKCAIENLLSNNSLRELISKNSRETAEKYHPNAVFSSYYKLYQGYFK